MNIRSMVLTLRYNIIANTLLDSWLQVKSKHQLPVIERLPFMIRAIWAGKMESLTHRVLSFRFRPDRNRLRWSAAAIRAFVVAAVGGCGLSRDLPPTEEIKNEPKRPWRQVRMCWLWPVPSA